MDSRTDTFEGTAPEVHPDAAVSREATLAGEVTVAPDVTVRPGAVRRGDVDPGELGRGSAIGDDAVLHGSTVGEGSMVGHGAVVSDSTVEAGAMGGFDASVSESVIGAESIVAMGSVIPPGSDAHLTDGHAELFD